MKKCFAIVAALFLFGCGGGGGGGGGTPPPPPPPPPPPVTGLDAFEQSLQGLSINNFYLVSMEGITRRSEETIIWRGLEDVYPIEFVNLDNLSESYRLETYEYYRVTLEALLTYDRSALVPAEQINYDVYEWYLESKLDELEFINYGFPATYSNFGIPGETLTFFTDIHPLENGEDAQNYVNRLTVIDNKFGQLEDWLLLQRDAGVIEPAITMDVAISQLSQIVSLNAAEVPYYTRFREDLTAVTDLTNAEKATLREVALASMFGDVLPAYQSLLNTLQTLRAQAPASIGVGQYPRGTDYYTYRLRQQTTTDLTAAEIHQLGLDELVRIHGEMRTIFDQLGYPQNETLEELYDRVAVDGGIVLAADALATFENLVAFAEANLNQAFDIVPMTPVVVLPDPFGGFYIAPSFDGSRPGAFYAGTEVDQPYAPMPSLTFHETYPGHHMQIAIALEQNLPPHRQAARPIGFIEGWGLYAERLAFELGWYNNDVYGNLGRLQFEALRAARLVIDTGIHGLDWTFDEAVQFNVENVGWSESQSQGAVARYSVIPGQATAYMVGLLQILDERQRAIDTLGNDFDLIAFHRALLTNGAVPLSVLPNVVDQYIADVQSGL